ncbi:MAG: hypothetical protein LKI94_08110 [Sporolactobacillus sp.]|jgi:hypothetical protein|nr:hypothetical protein [Sporolactobacillus sp.]MCI1882139.1 hypothetical protein [Sporolactobacillus sp.]
MLSDFERKVAQIMKNDQIMKRVTLVSDLQQRTGHSRGEVEAAMDKVKRTRKSDGGLL